MVRRAWYSRSSLKAILSTPPPPHPYGLGTNPITHLLPRHPRGQDALPALPGDNHEAAVVVLVLSAVCVERGAVCMERVGEACSRVGATMRATVDDVLCLVPAVRVVCCPNNAHSFFRTQAGFLVFLSAGCFVWEKRARGTRRFLSTGRGSGCFLLRRYHRFVPVCGEMLLVVNYPTMGNFLFMTKDSPTEFIYLCNRSIQRDWSVRP